MEIVVLNDRVTELVGRFEVEKDRIPKDIEERTRVLTKQLTEFQELFIKEQERRVERENALESQLTDHEHVVTTRFDEERSTREKKHMRLQRVLDHAIESRIKGDERFQAFTREELAELRNALQKEVEIREQEDDEVVETLTAYTKKLQSSLHIINSMDT